MRTAAAVSKCLLVPWSVPALVHLWQYRVWQSAAEGGKGSEVLACGVLLNSQRVLQKHEA